MSLQAAGLALMAAGVLALVGFVVVQVRADTRRTDWTCVPGPGVAGWSLVIGAACSILCGVILAAVGVFSG